MLNNSLNTSDFEIIVVKVRVLVHLKGEPKYVVTYS
jgi:hypothetical protein